LLNIHRIKRLDEVWQGAYRAVESLFKEDLAAERLEVIIVPNHTELFSQLTII